MPDEFQHDAIRLAAVIPVFNNGRTLAAVIAGVRAHIPDIVAVNDGSTDDTAAVLAGTAGIHVVTFARNRGKGAALLAGFAAAAQRGCTHVLTIDADGQHLPGDIPAFLQALRRSPATLWIGNRCLDAGGAPQPGRSRFGAGFGSFWYRFHTGLRIHDTQCGMRLYPLRSTLALGCRAGRYEFEIDALIRAAWARIPVAELPIRRLYHAGGERVSHFRPVRDFARISMVNSRAALTRIFMPWRFMEGPPGATAWHKVRLRMLRELTTLHSPRRAAAALALGAAIGVTPFHGVQVISAIGLSLLLRLNRPLAVLGVGISSAPLLPFWLMGQYALGTYVLPTPAIAAMARACLHMHLHTLAQVLQQTAAVYFLQWLSGSVVSTPVVGVLVFAIAYPLFAWHERARSR